ncbi:MAG: hypothetical protein IJ866_01215 [Alphaproteobacteria bacterium]|nr:hypothetical protein [Alphaproteobacteria bacterium]
MTERVRQHKMVYPDGSTFPRDSKMLFKSEVVFYVLKAFAGKHIYGEIMEIFGDVRNGDETGRGYQNDCVMRVDDVPENKKMRFNMDRPITSADGVVFVVNTNWGEPMPGDADSWGAFKDAANRAGYKVL